ncbi:MAG TPA: CopD family protein [Candidatus Deferrimicrobiaceae bacterium]|nr:CopD family protein [Candidatus Deferrimicrobiaceae bacterium]
MTYRLLVAFHLLGATVWVGGHLVLSLSVLPRALRARDPAIVREFESGFERLGIPALLVQIVTGLWLASHWAPDVAGWFSPSTPQAQLVLVKLALLAATVALAIHARLRVVPRLDAATLGFLAYHVVAVTLLGVALLVVGVVIRTGAVLW